MSLWEYGAIMHGWKERQPKDPNAGGFDPDALDGVDEPDAEAWAHASVQTARVVRAAEQGDKG